MNEFEIIRHYFQRLDEDASGDVILGIGDDAAVITIPSDQQLVLCMDTLVNGVHFPEQTKPSDIAYKALAVNLSDMAAMGAEPRWITLSLTVPQYDPEWFESFTNGLQQLATQYQLSLVGGDLCRGPLSVTVQLQGLVPGTAGLQRAILTRAGAHAGDVIYVTGTLGGAAYALKSILEPGKWSTPSSEEMNRLYRPEARVDTGKRLRSLATSCIDISDGLQSDLMHILSASAVGAELEVEKLPYSNSLQALQQDEALELALTGGDDYELCFTLPEDTSASMLEELNKLCPITRIGRVTAVDSQLLLKNRDGEDLALDAAGWRHF